MFIYLLIYYEKEKGGVHAKVYMWREQDNLGRSKSFLLLGGSGSGCQASWKGPLPAEPSVANPSIITF